MSFVLSMHTVPEGAVIPVAVADSADADNHNPADPAQLVCDNDLLVWRLNNKGMPEAEYHARLEAMRAAGDGLVLHSGTVQAVVSGTDPTSKLLAALIPDAAAALNSHFAPEDLARLAADGVAAEGGSQLTASLVAALVAELRGKL